MFSQKNNQTANKSIESSEIKYKWTFKFSKKIKKEGVIRSNYFGFFLLYFAISVMVIYVPVYLLNILNVDTSQLAFIQVFVYLVMFSGPVLGYIFDKYSKNKKLILVSSSILFLVS